VQCDESWAFCYEKKGTGGEMRRFQYKFVEPLMQPYVLMQGLADGLITEEHLDVPASSSEQRQLLAILER
jgi:hypothetical protein